MSKYRQIWIDERSDRNGNAEFEFVSECEYAVRKNAGANYSFDEEENKDCNSVVLHFIEHQALIDLQSKLDFAEGQLQQNKIYIEHLLHSYDSLKEKADKLRKRLGRCVCGVDGKEVLASIKEYDEALAKKENLSEM